MKVLVAVQSTEIFGCLGYRFDVFKIGKHRLGMGEISDLRPCVFHFEKNESVNGVIKPVKYYEVLYRLQQKWNAITLDLVIESRMENKERYTDLVYYARISQKLFMACRGIWELDILTEELLTHENELIRLITARQLENV